MTILSRVPVIDISPQASHLVQLAVRVFSGDVTAEEEIVRLFQRPVRAFVLMSTGIPQLADELVQEVMWAAICALREGRVEQPAQMGAFIRGIARNLIADHARARAREKLSPLPDDLPHPGSGHELFERNHAARQAIATLDPHEQAVLLLALVDGLGPEEIGRRLGVTGEVVRQRKSRALRRLTELLKDPSQTRSRSLLKDKK
jgi:RNA polymerase sigma factor (sigma-70 family)